MCVRGTFCSPPLLGFCLGGFLEVGGEGGGCREGSVLG